jgi:hypothetical protein
MAVPVPSIRFVVLRHDGVPEPHFDLMIEAPGRSYLFTWRCPHDPLERYVTVCHRIHNHRIRYLDYEGPLSGNRGSVVRVRAGTGRFFRSRLRPRGWVLAYDGAGGGRYPGYLMGPGPNKRWVLEGWTPGHDDWTRAEREERGEPAQ